MKSTVLISGQTKFNIYLVIIKTSVNKAVIFPIAIKKNQQLFCKPVAAKNLYICQTL